MFKFFSANNHRELELMISQTLRLLSVAIMDYIDQLDNFQYHAVLKPHFESSGIALFIWRNSA